MKKDDLTVGPMALHFRRLAIPAALGMLFATLYNVVDVCLLYTSPSPRD